MKNRRAKSRGQEIAKLVAVVTVLLTFPTALLLHSRWNMKQMTQPVHSADQNVEISDYGASPAGNNQVVVLENTAPAELPAEELEMPVMETPVYDSYDLIGIGRGKDTDTKEYWTRQLNAGAMRQHLLNSFTYDSRNSEFCKEYGITGEIEYVDLVAVGDNLYHLMITNSGLQEDGTYNYDGIYANIKDYISEADIRIINQEVVLTSDRSQWTNFPVFGAPIECGEAVVNAGFNVITHATNHSWDKGRNIALEDIEFWKSQDDVLLTGMYDSPEDYDNIVIGEYKGVKVAYLNYTQNLNGFTLPADSKYMVKLIDIELIKADIAKAREQADIVIVFPHWGEEYQTTPSWYQKSLAQQIANAGADLIIGTHPHVIQPLEILTTADGKEVPCFYSLGNFVSNMPWNETYVEALAKVRIKKQGNKVSIESVEAVPLVNYRGVDMDYTVYLLEDYTTEISRTQRKWEITPTYVENFFDGVFTTKYYEMKQD